jgi:hypothetical protein
VREAISEREEAKGDRWNASTDVEAVDKRGKGSHRGEKEDESGKGPKAQCCLCKTIMYPAGLTLTSCNKYIKCTYNSMCSCYLQGL